MTERRNTWQSKSFQLAVSLSKVLIATLFFFLIPLAVAVNAFGIAERLAPLPGIRKTGGIGSGIVALVYILSLGGLILGSVVATGLEVPIISGDSPEPVSNTSSPTPSTDPSTPTATSTATPTATTTDPTPTPTDLERRELQLHNFSEGYLSLANETVENETYTGVQIIGSEYQTSDDRLEYWVVFWECRQHEQLVDQRVSTANIFLNTVADHEGEKPDQIRIYGATDLSGHIDTITYINTSEAEAAYNGSMDSDTYFDTWWDRQRKPSAEENATAFAMTVNESGQQLAQEAFYEGQEEVGGCPGKAEPGTG